MTDNIYESFNRQLRESAVKKLEEKEKNKVVNPNASKTIKAPYVIKHGDECDYFS